MTVSRERVEEALKDVEMICFSPEHNERYDVWKVEISDEAVSFISTKYLISLNIQFSLLPDVRGKGKLRNEIEMRLVFFIEGLESGVNLTRAEVNKGLGSLFTSYLETAPDSVKENLAQKALTAG